MLNYVKIFGRLVNPVKVEKDEEGNEFAIITISTPREKPEKDGSYQHDYVDVFLTANDAIELSKCSKKSDLVGIIGHIKARTTEKGKNKIEIIADKFTHFNVLTPEK